jgi:hypothetical protein
MAGGIFHDVFEKIGSMQKLQPEEFVLAGRGYKLAFRGKVPEGDIAAI